ncbi:hypothetical protein [Tenacibaculum agarivorans]|uniref:hypothetical protein n=1 Tax=Tenacibaculum agarivorans TaxID=1908389 RepID=UPI00094B7DAB|nr:hypothetical protein [Tenacibaculum agarivorans]
MEKFNSLIEIKIQLYHNHKLKNGMVYELDLYKIKGFEAVKIDGILKLPKPTQKTLSAKTEKLVYFKSNNFPNELDFLISNRRFKIIDLEENCYVGKGKIIGVTNI